ncbi:hypothetical protein [Pseudovibrio ascidiaceicola]|uniref:hypothetical protein n=1 Tax=Pseudovibrio ascidiaceicola TaxID=285279 RepID=UPI00135B3DEC|nr:hypothetical protein [Pseudovibrio ascidiaceicola]
MPVLAPRATASAVETIRETARTAGYSMPAFKRIIEEFIYPLRWSERQSRPSQDPYFKTSEFYSKPPLMLYMIVRRDWCNGKTDWLAYFQRANGIYSSDNKPHSTFEEAEAACNKFHRDHILKLIDLEAVCSEVFEMVANMLEAITGTADKTPCPSCSDNDANRCDCVEDYCTCTLPRTNCDHCNNKGWLPQTPASNLLTEEEGKLAAFQHVTHAH